MSSTEYVIALEDGADNLPEIMPLYRRHYAEMEARLEAEGVEIGPFAPKVEQYVQAWTAGHLLNIIARLDGEPVGYCNVYLTNDMHNGELIAQEDTVYVLPEHRNGLGKTIVKFGLDVLRAKGVKRLTVTASTDPRVPLLWKRMGFKPVAVQMMYTF